VDLKLSNPLLHYEVLSLHLVEYLFFLLQHCISSRYFLNECFLFHYLHVLIEIFLKCQLV
jgi:hypothetical protein